MLDDETVRTVIKGLNEDHEKQEQKYNNAITMIQNLCNHTKLIKIAVGKQCDNCGKVFLSEDILERK